MRSLLHSLPTRMNRNLVTLLTLGCILCGCRPPGAPEGPEPLPRVVLAWRAPSTGIAGALLDPTHGPATRLVLSPEASRLEPIDRALQHLDPLRPVEIPEPSQPGVVRLSVSADLAGLGSRSNLLCSLESALEAGREHLRGGLSSDRVSNPAETPALCLALDHRAELFWQLAAAFREVATVPPHAVLTNAAAVASTHARIALRCETLARDLDQFDGILGRAGAQRWLDPGPDSLPISLRGFPGEWRQRACRFQSLLPTEDAEPLRAVPMVRDWWRSREVLSDRFPAMEEAIRTTVLGWERHLPRSLQGNPLAEALASSCQADRADLIRLSRFCSQQATAPGQPQKLSEAFVRLGSQSLGASQTLARIADELTGTRRGLLKAGGS